MAVLPAGTVTFLFSDIEGSTLLLQELGPERYAEALAEHRGHLREAFLSCGGVEVDTQGDAFFVVFPEASGALAAATRAQAALGAGPIRVRMGLHSGRPLVTDEGYVGMDVHQGARVMSAGHGGQVLVSEATFALLDSAAGLIDLGLHRLKDLTEPQQLYQLGNEQFPPLKTLYQANLPVQPTPLLGREAELAEVLGLLREGRLVTLTGAGGSGKTRLALQAAAEMVEESRHGVWWVSLAALRDPRLVEETIAQAVGARDGLADHLRERTALLLLDNFEHVLDGAGVVSELLARAPKLRVLATSRERLGLSGEQEYAVPSMRESDAVALFTATACRLQPGFEPDRDVPEICRRLDGLPLAVELAAARTKLLSTSAILERLGRSLDLLTAGSRDAPERHRTLRATIEWSYELLSEEERGAFDCLAVFPGSYSLEAAEAVSGADLDVLAALVDKSLVRRTAAQRFFLLDTIRAFAFERLLSAGRADELRRRHLAFFHRFTEEVAKELADHLQAHTLSRIEAERENLRAAVSAAHAFGEFERLAEMLANVGSQWIWAGAHEEARTWFERALEHAPEERPDLTAALFARLGDVAFARGEWDECDRLQLQALAVPHAGVDGRLTSRSLVRLSQTSLLRGDLVGAEARAGEAATVARAAGYRRGATIAQSLLGDIALREREYGRARELFATAVQQFREQGEDASLALVLGNLALAELRDGEDALAVNSAKEMFPLLRASRDTFSLSHALELLAALLVQRGKIETAAVALASGEAFREEQGWELQPAELELHAETVAAVEAALAQNTLATNPFEEPPLTVDDAVAAGLAALD